MLWIVAFLLRFPISVLSLFFRHFLGMKMAFGEDETPFGLNEMLFGFSISSLC